MSQDKRDSYVSGDRTEKKKNVQRSDSHERGGGNRAVFIAIAVSLIIILGSVVAYYFLARQGSDDLSNDAQDGPPDTENIPGGDVVTLSNIDNNLVGIPLAPMNQTARFFRYNISGAEVQLFAVRDGNGTVHTAFNACLKCYKKHAGFRQQGDAMLELCCMMTFPIERITKEGCNITGCHPAYLKTSMNESMLIIAKSDLAAGAYLFAGNEFSGLESVDIRSVAIPLISISQTATWYKYNVSGATVRFLAVKDANGTVHTTFDSCAKCYKKHAGLRQEGGMLTENCCNMGYPTSDVNAANCALNRTGCHPAYLKCVVNGSRVVMAKSDLAAGAYMFKTVNESAMVEEYDATSIAIPLSSVSALASWYICHINGTDVRFLAVSDTNGTVHTSFDTCAKCFKKHSGLRQEGGMIVENCCNMGYPIDKICADTCGIDNMSCHPLYLPSTVVGTKVVIEKADLEANSHLFKT